MSSVGTSEPPKLAEYDVFLSFRGLDTRRTFADYLYHDLIGVGIRVFRDDEELYNGKEIATELHRAISNSRICIPILSKNYATSAWCLREVAHMVECRQKSRGALEIMPIFYDVDVSNVKLRTGSSYEVHIEEHRARFEDEVILQWKNALKEVAKIKGWDVNSARGHGELVKSIVQEVLAKLNINYRNLPKKLVGIHQAEAIMQLINAEAEGVRFIVIHGMGGIGKTTLAQVVFNWLNTRYDGCSFVENVRESSKLQSILYLQKKLLSDIYPKFANHIKDPSDGINQIRTRLCSKKVFIVLDDVDHEKQLKNLAGSSGWFGFGSRIIITTRDRGVLLMQGEKEKYFHYDVDQMKFNDALRLFSWHSFGMDYPPNDYTNLSKEIVSATASLPLALEVIGSSLFCKCLGACECKTIWEDTLDELRRVPDKNVEETLMISIDRLKENERTIFLDIACFLINEDKTNAIYMWRDCQLFPNRVISCLVQMSLIKIDQCKFRMHDQLRDLGRAIVHREKKKLGVPTRVWNDQEVEEFMEKKQGTEVTEVLLLDSVYHNLTDDESAKLENLRFLTLQGQFEGDFKNLLPNLRWIRWDHDFSDIECTNLYPSNLVVLEMCRSDICNDWKGWQQLKMANRLKVLDLRLCYWLTTTPEFSSFFLLERLILEHCSHLVEIGPSIGKLRKLAYLSVNDCKSFRKLPESVGNLTNLNHLSLKMCRNLSKLPESIGNLTSLVELDLSYSEKIIELPNSIGNLKKLKVICMNRTGIRRLPASLGLLKSLEELHASECPYLIGETPRSFSNLSHLKELHLCIESLTMECLPVLPSSLNILEIKASWMEVSSDLSYLLNLTDLTLHIRRTQQCVDLFWPKKQQCMGLQWICKLSKLKRLSIKDAFITMLGDEFSSLVRLEHLYLCCFSVIWPLRLPSGLITLSIKSGKGKSGGNRLLDDGFSLAVAIPCLRELQMLRTLTLESLEFTDLDGLHLLRNLRKLEIRCLHLCRRFPDLSNSKNMTRSLEHITIERCGSLEALYGLSSMMNLRSLTVLDCASKLHVEGLETLTASLGSMCNIDPDITLQPADQEGDIFYLFG